MDLAGQTACQVGEPVGEMVSKDQIGYGEQPLAGVPSRLGWVDRPVRCRCRTRDQLRNSDGNSFSAPQAGQVVLSKGTRSFGPIPHAITKPQLPQT
jgi:hypothetical protein